MTIAEVSRQYGLSQDTLRYYERVGLLPAVNRNKSGNRDYTEDNTRWVEFIKCMRGAGISVEALIEYVAMYQKGESTRQARLALLKEQREAMAARVAELTSTLARLDKKIAMYDDVILPKK